MAGGGKTDRILPRIHYTIGHEMGIMFGFIGLFIVATAAFTVFWLGKNKRQERVEMERQDALRQAGWGLEGWKNEKGEFGGKTPGAGAEQEERIERVNERNGVAGNGVLGQNETGIKEKGSLGELR